MADTDAEGDEKTAGGQTSRIPLLQEKDVTTAPSEREIAEYNNQKAAKNRERFIYRLARRFVVRPLKWFIGYLDAHGGAITAAATAAIAVLTYFLASYAYEQGVSFDKQLNVMQGQLDAMRADVRAWVGPLGAFYEGSLTENGPFKINITYSNTGREPAPTDRAVEPVSYSEADWNNGEAAKSIIAFKDMCMMTSAISPIAGIVYPTNGVNSFQLHVDTGRTDIPKPWQATNDKDFIDGKKILAIEGCFVYRTVEKIHHSAFCFYH